MLIDNHRIGQTQTGRQRHRAFNRAHIALPAADHMFRHDRGPRRGARNRHPRRIAPPDRLSNRGAAKDRRQPQLVAAGDKDAGGALQHLDIAGVFAIGAAVDRQEFDPRRTKIAEHPVIIRPGGFHLRGGRNDDNIGRGPAGKFDKKAVNMHVLDPVLTPANRDDKAAFSGRVQLRRAHSPDILSMDVRTARPEIDRLPPKAPRSCHPPRPWAS